MIGEGNSSPGPVSADVVLQVLTGSLSIEFSTRAQAEQMLRMWEADAAPGFVSSLLRIVEQRGAIDEAIRLLACVVAKNAVGSSWRKTLGSREWSKVPEEEKKVVLEGALTLLLTDPSEKIATQLSLLVTNIARFDFPGRSPELLEALAGFANWDSPHPPQSRLRALKCLRRVLNGLSTKRFVMEPPKPGTRTALIDLRQLSQQVTQERELYKMKVAAAFAPIRDLFNKYSEEFLACSPGWEMHGQFAKAAISCVAELLPLAPTGDLHEGTSALLKWAGFVGTCALTGPDADFFVHTGALDPAATRAWTELARKVFEHAGRAMIAYLDNYAIPFAGFVAPFLTLFVNGALISLSAEEVRNMRPKFRVILVRFIAKALLNPYYRPEWVNAILPAALPPSQRQRMGEAKELAARAHHALEGMLEGNQAVLLTEAVITKYVALAPEELAEWREDPEGYSRSMEVESGPDADSPRPIGVGLLLCMLERGGEPVVQALLGLAARLQVSGTPSTDALLLREAAYRCIGEGYNHVSQHFSFQAWFENELAPQLSCRLQEFTTKMPDLIPAVLQSRALWLVGACGQDLPHEDWCKAFKLVVAHMASMDVVVALTAVSAALGLSAQILDDQAVLDTHDMAQRKAQGTGAGMPSMVEALRLADDVEEAAEAENSGVIAEARERMRARLSALEGDISTCLTAAFALLGRLAEVESMVRVLQLISVLVEVLGERIGPHLPVIASALPALWAAASGAPPSTGKDASKKERGADGESRKIGDSGAVVRLHSALIAVLTHLVGKLKGMALRNSQVAGVVYPLLQYSTSLSTPESECLVEEAFRLWSCSLSAVPEVPQELILLLPNLAAILKRGKDNTAVLPIVESYLLLGAGTSVIPLVDLIQSALLNAVSGVEQAAIASVQGAASMPPAGLAAGPGGVGSTAAPKAFPPEVAAEAMAASALSDVMLQLSPQEVPALLAPTFRAMVHFVAHPGLLAQNVNVKIVNVMEGFLEVLGRVFLTQPASFVPLVLEQQQQQGQQGEGQPVEAAGSSGGSGVGSQSIASLFLDKWLSVASARFLEEVIGVKTMAMLGRYRRRIATAALCALVIHPTSGPAVQRSLVADVGQVVRLCSLALQVILDDREFHADQTDLDTLDFKTDLNEDYVLVRRLSITRHDAVRSMSPFSAVQGLLVALASAMGGIQALGAALQNRGSPALAARASAVLSGSIQELYGLTGNQGSSDADGPDGYDDDIDELRQPSPAGNGSDLSD
uniref:Importin N-terminal domain-containing protein n=1 Tax=Dunaliella tertiolecta TaxID=3047 RepID=A0A7S3VSI4_DUNTE|mmetsp:Transcript_12504/g.34139  ORF Transcript_12504/g.34139 Transcript_12504/m.34139 type:complete len:1254 (+) Transcript_12504:49-3810(+)